MKFQLKKSALIACFFAGIPAITQAAGFQVFEQNASRLGDAYAGGAAEANDASVIYYNPAGLTHLNGQQVNVSGLAFLPNMQFNNTGSTRFPGMPLTGGNSGNATPNTLIPNFYYAGGDNNGIKYGLGITTPYGVKTSYDRDWVGRYYAVESALEVVDFSPAIATKISPQTSIGAALDVQYAHAKLSKALDLGTQGFAYSIPGFLPQENDGFAEVTGHDWGVGYHIGLQHDIDANTRIGLQYRSKIHHRIDATATFTNIPAPFAPVFQNSGAHTDVTMPDSVSLSGEHKLTPRLTVLGDITWTHWNRFNELNISFNNGLPNDVTTEQWKNTWRYGLGINYQHSEKVTLRAGVAYDQGPVDGIRTPAIPDGSRTTLAVGGNYKLSNHTSLDLGYAHLFIPNGGVNLSNVQQGTLTGYYTGHVDIVGLQYNYSF